MNKVITCVRIGRTVCFDSIWLKQTVLRLCVVNRVLNHPTLARTDTIRSRSHGQSPSTDFNRSENILIHAPNRSLAQLRTFTIHNSIKSISSWRTRRTLVCVIDRTHMHWTRVDCCSSAMSTIDFCEAMKSTEPITSYRDSRRKNDIRTRRLSETFYF